MKYFVKLLGTIETTFLDDMQWLALRLFGHFVLGLGGLNSYIRLTVSMR